VSICDVRVDFTDPEGYAVGVRCSLPADHAEDHSGRVWWSNDCSPVVASSGETE
jgi:hypothetical protein